MSNLEHANAVLDTFPQDVTLENGQTISLRTVAPDDRDPIIAFAKNLDETDLLFLRVDITKPAAVNNWLKNVDSGETVSLLAIQNNEVLGYASVDRNPARWTRRVGEIRVNVTPDYRSLGLGRHLTAKIFDVARGLGLKKLVAHMTPDQTGAQAAFSRLGFVPEALLANYVEDRQGNVHDMAILSYDIDGLTTLADEPLMI